MLLATTPFQNFPLADFTPEEQATWRRMHLKHVACSEPNIRPFLHVSPFPLKHFHHSCLVRVDEEQQVLQIQGQIYARDVAKNQSGLYVHRMLTDLQGTTLSPLPLVYPLLQTNRPPAPLPPIISGLVIECSWEYFQTSPFQHVHPGSYMLQGSQTFLENYTRFSVNVNLEEFFLTRDSVSVETWLTHRFANDKPPILLYHNPAVDYTHQPNTTLRGGIIHGPSGSGKTSQMLRLVFQKACTETRPTIYFTSISDRGTIQYFYNSLNRAERASVEILFDAKRLKKYAPRADSPVKLVLLDMDMLKNYPNILILHRFERAVIDLAPHRKQIPLPLISLAVPSMWILVTTMTPHIFTEILMSYRISTRFDTSFLPHTFDPLVAGLFQNCTFYHTKAPTRQDTQAIEIPRRADLFPKGQIRRAVQQTLESGLSAEINGLLALLYSIDSGLLLEQRELQTALVRFNRRPEEDEEEKNHELLPWSEMKHQTISSTELRELICPICQEEWEQPIRNERCSHVFCRSCLQEWTRTHNSCPMCRKDFSVSFMGLDVTFPLGTTRKRKLPLSLPLPTIDPSTVYGRKVKSRALALAIQNSVYGKILIVTHYHEMLSVYRETIEQSSPSPNPAIWVAAKKFSRNTSLLLTDCHIDKSKYILTHADNMDYFRNDGRIEQVIFVDNDSGFASLAKWKTFFSACQSKLIYYCDSSIDKFLMTCHHTQLEKLDWRNRELLQRFLIYIRSVNSEN